MCSSLVGLPQGKREMGEWIVERKHRIEEADDMVQYLAFGMKVLGRCDCFRSPEILKATMAWAKG